MYRFWLLFSLIVGLCCYSISVLSVAYAEDVETLRITATAATSDQYSATIGKPDNAEAILVIIKVTAGTTLALDVHLQVYSPTYNAWLSYAANCPSSEGITGASTTWCYFGSRGLSTDYDLVTDLQVHLPPLFRIAIDHGNANAATYTVYSQWMKR